MDRVTSSVTDSTVGRDEAATRENIADLIVGMDTAK